MEPTHLALLAVIVLTANTVEAMAGFGATVIAVTLGSQFMPIEQLVPMLVPVNLFLSAWIVARHRGHIDRRELGRYILPFAGLGLPVGFAVFALTPGRILEVLFGVFVVCFALREIALYLKSNGKTPARLPTWQGALWLFGGGIAQGLYASGGPMVVYYASRAIADKSAFRATLSTLWLILGTVLAVAHYLTGKADLGTYKASAWLLLPLVGGIVLGELLHDRIPQEKFRFVVMILLSIAGAGLLV